SFFFYAVVPTGIFSLSLHDALPILNRLRMRLSFLTAAAVSGSSYSVTTFLRSCLSATLTCSLASFHCSLILAKATFEPSALISRSEEHTSDSSHDQISYAVFCLKKK